MSDPVPRPIGPLTRMALDRARQDYETVVREIMQAAVMEHGFPPGTAIDPSGACWLIPTEEHAPC